MPRSGIQAVGQLPQVALDRGELVVGRGGGTGQLPGLGLQLRRQAGRQLGVPAGAAGQVGYRRLQPVVPGGYVADEVVADAAQVGPVPDEHAGGGAEAEPGRVHLDRPAEHRQVRPGQVLYLDPRGDPARMVEVGVHGQGVPGHEEAVVGGPQ